MELQIETEDILKMQDSITQKNKLYDTKYTIYMEEFNNIKNMSDEDITVIINQENVRINDRKAEIDLKIEESETEFKDMRGRKNLI
jgi:hypothetical protein